LSIIFDRAKDFYKQQGLITLLRNIFAFLIAYENFTCYLYESTLKRRNEDDFKPRIKEFTIKIVSTKQQLDVLINDGFNLSLHSAEIKRRLEKGAIGCLEFVEKDLASVEWVAMNAQAKAAIDDYPCRIYFSNKEAYAGGVWTDSKFRGKGLHMYVYYKIYDYLRENGIVTVRSIVEVNNTAAIKVHEKFAPEEKIYARAHYLRITGLKFWRETPVSQSSVGNNSNHSP
jgi:ribosomal protein S18 acetylase RimI-like enzyme